MHFFFRVHLALVITSFSIDIWSLIRDMYFRRKKIYQKSSKSFFFWNSFMIVDRKISFTFRSWIHLLNVERKLSKEKFNHQWKKNFSVYGFRNFAKFTGKHLCQSLFFNKVAGKISKNTFPHRTPLMATFGDYYTLTQ